MSPFRAIAVLLAVAMVAAQYVTERHHMAVIERLPGAEARDYYEAARRKGERSLLAFTVALALGGVVSAIYLVAWPA